MLSRSPYEPILDGGVKSTYYFNGRFLSAEDLRADQEANREQHRQLGLATGYGVVTGLEVKATGTSGTEVTVTRGLAVAPSGQPLLLGVDVDPLSLAPQATGNDSSGASGGFQDYEALLVKTVPTGDGPYLLVLAPATGLEGRAPITGFQDGGKITGCGRKYAREGVQFKLVPVTLPAGLSTNADILRNRVAHLFFGTASLATFPQGLFSLPDSYGLVDDLRTNAFLAADEVPLALLYWSSGKMLYADMWAVRRRLIQPPVGVPWALHAGGRRLAEAEAVFLQFQDHLDSLGSESGFSTMTASSRFQYLPPVGYLPKNLSTSIFFQGLHTQTVALDPAFVRSVIHESAYVDPIDLYADKAVLVGLYEPAGQDFVLFFRRDRRNIEVTDTPEEELETPGKLLVAIALEGSSGGVSAGGEDVSFARIAKKMSSINLIGGEQLRQSSRQISVIAYDSVRKAYRGKLTKVSPRKGKLADGLLYFVIDSLPPDTYQVVVKAHGYRDGKQSKQVESGETAEVEFVLRKGKTGTKPSREPKGSIKVTEKLKEDYGKVALLPSYVAWEGIPAVVKEWEQVTDPPREMEEWLLDWASHLAEKYPEAAIDPGGIQVVVDPEHSPGVRSDAPYAYVLFGKSGVHAPLVLVPHGQAMENSVTALEAGLTGIDRDTYQDKLKADGLDAVDTIAFAPANLLAASLGVSSETAGGMTSQAKGALVKLRNNVQTIRGVQGSVAEVVEGLDIVGLANQDPAKLAAALEEKGIADAETVGKLLVDRARVNTATSSWSLATPEIGLKSSQVQVLTQMGIGSQGDFKAAAGVSATKLKIAAALGVTTAQVDEIVARMPGVN